MLVIERKNFQSHYDFQFKKCFRIDNVFEVVDKSYGNVVNQFIKVVLISNGVNSKVVVAVYYLHQVFFTKLS